MAVPVSVRADVPDVPFDESMPIKFWKVTALEAMRLVVDAVVAVIIVVEAPPFIEKRPEVIVDDAFDRKPFVNVARPVRFSVEVAVIAPPKKLVPLVY